LGAARAVDSNRQGLAATLDLHDGQQGVGGDVRRARDG
jgi:hypothetical protein